MHYVSFSFSQSFKFVDFKNRWKVDWYQSAIPFPEERIYFFNGDSVLVGNKYFQQMVYTSKFSPEPKLSDYEFRQEGSKLYSTYLSNEPYLIFDFDAEVGDTIFSKYDEFSSFDKIIEEVDTLTLNNGDKVKRYKVSCLEDGNENTLTWIEGIGDVILLFQPEVQCSLFDPQDREELRCFGREGEVLFSMENEDECKIDGFDDSFRFVDEDNEWYYLVGGIFSPPRSERRRFDFNDSLMLGERKYVALKYSKDEFGDDNFNHNLGYYYEEDSKVYSWDGIREKLIYNFNLIKGDTFIDYDEGFDTKFIVEKITYRYLRDGSYVKVLTLICDEGSFNFEFDWIEGVGSDLIGNQCIIDGSDGSLRCFLRNKDIVYKLDNDLSCWTVSTNDGILHKFSISPNPGNSSFKISSEKSINKINVKTLDGKLISTIYKSIEVDASSLMSGLYFVQAHFSDGSIAVEKWIKE